MVLENEQEPSSSPRAALQSTPASSRMSTIRPITSTPDVKMVGNDEGEDGEVKIVLKHSLRPVVPPDLDTFFLSDDDEVEIRAKGGSSTRRKLLSRRPSADDDTGSRPSFPSALSSNNFLTATEQSAQNSKKGKKASEYCYSFLVDRRDVGSFITLMCKPFSPIPSFAFLERWKGKFFEHSAFDLKLTDRVKMKMGYKVGRVDQTETSLGAEMCATKKGGAKDIVRRKMRAGQTAFGLWIMDASAGEFNFSTFTDDVCVTKLKTVICQLWPKVNFILRDLMIYIFDNIVAMIIANSNSKLTVKDDSRIITHGVLASDEDLSTSFLCYKSATLVPWTERTIM
ncbi:hypothetical protein BS47DRAFT_1384353 [Hydnum rufescens UP504]|uniref:Uncharacterized protein n=1 Tax=Hydnum rufescens UP504 TaxID=1448309 RepID=A0A9P6APG9_9AGAM|nr:hypothetical protein BS47DRAFT_1384353 [Hydnum rufescens UP504]